MFGLYVRTISGKWQATECALLPAVISKSLWHTYLLTELRPSWEAVNLAAIQEIPSNFKEPEGSSPCSQEPSAGPLSWASSIH
jgi:hypothetical protein